MSWSSFCHLLFVSLCGSLFLLSHQCFHIVKARVSAWCNFHFMQINLTQCRAHQSNLLTYCWVFWFHWFRSGPCYCLLLFVSSMLLFVWFLKWRMYLCGTVFILLKCTWRSDSLDKECLGHTGPVFCHIYTHSIIKRKSHTLFLHPSLPSFCFLVGVCVAAGCLLCSPEEKCTISLLSKRTSSHREYVCYWCSLSLTWSHRCSGCWKQ